MAQKNMKKYALVALLGLVIIAFFASGLHNELTLDSIKNRQAEFQGFYDANPALTIGVFAGIYIIITALSLPGAAVMTLAGGAFLGFIPGLIAVSFASTIGATLAFLAARFLLRDWVQGKFGDKLQKINEGVEKEGIFYLFALRLTVVVPFFVINLVMGLTPMKTWKYYIGSQIAMLPGTTIYVYAGQQLGQISSVGDILSPTLIVAFAMLGAFPLLAKKGVDFMRAKKTKTTAMAEGTK